MNTLGELLRKYIDKSGNTVYGISKAANINRSTLQKALTGERNLSIDLLDQLYPFLKLTQNEKNELLKLMDIKENGKELHEQREFIRAMIEHISDTIFGNQIALSGIRDSDKQRNIEFKNTQVFYGNHAIKNLLIFLIDFECKAKKPKLYTNIPGNQSIVHEVFEHTLYYSGNYSDLDIKHIIHFTKESQPNMCINNLETFSYIVPLISIAGFPYDVYYNYQAHNTTEFKNSAFPYYILGTDWCALISEDCMTALYCNTKEVVLYLENLFEAELSNSTPLASLCEKPDDIFPYLIKVNSTDTPHYCVEYQPCLLTYLTDEMIQKYSKTNVENYTQIIQYLSLRREQMQHLSSHTCYFSKSGLLSFTESGRMVDFPEEYAEPLDKSDRKILLESFYNEIENGLQNHRMINPHVLLISDYFTYCVTEGKGLAFFGYSDNKRQYNYIIIEELTMIESFIDFSKYLLSSPYVYTKNETLDFLKQCINSL